MKSGLHLALMLSMILGALLIVAACAPVAVLPPGGQTPTVSVFLPGIEQPGIAISPLQPAMAITETASLAPTVAVLPTETPQPAVVGPTWQWVSSAFKDGTLLAPADPSRYTFQLLPDGNALVQADCNFGTATYQETAAGFSFGPIGTTKMACPADSLDSEFLGQLRNIERYDIDDDGLKIFLLDEAGDMQFRTVEAEPLEEASTTPVPSVAPPTLAPTPTLPPSTVAPAPTLPAPTVAPTPTLPAPTVAPTPTLPAPTVAPAPTLPAPTVAPAPTSPIQPTPQPVQEASLEGTSWVLRNLWVDGQAISPVRDTIVTLEVAADGSHISGSAGCNLYRAMLATDAAGLTVTAPALMTRKACAANVMVQEVEFIDALLLARTYAVSEDELALFASNNEPLMVLVRR
jgi:heat shock protein HslJ